MKKIGAEHFLFDPSMLARNRRMSDEELLALMLQEEQERDLPHAERLARHNARLLGYPSLDDAPRSAAQARRMGVRRFVSQDGHVRQEWWSPAAIAAFEKEVAEMREASLMERFRKMLKGR